MDGDTCAMDGYVASIYTIAIGSVDQDGMQAPYDEDCPSKMAVTSNHNARSHKKNNVVSDYNAARPVPKGLYLLLVLMYTICFIRSLLTSGTSVGIISEALVQQVPSYLVSLPLPCKPSELVHTYLIHSKHS